MCGNGRSTRPGAGPALSQNRKTGLTGGDRDGSRRRLLANGLAGLLLLAAPAARGETTRIEALGLNGYDPVSYFMPDGPRGGSARFELPWNGQVWRFALEANRAAFQRDPTVYLPRLGGFDAAGILDRRLVEADPTVFAILDGHLYLFRDAERRQRFLEDPALARQAEAIWPGLTRLLDDPDDVRSGAR